MSPCGAAPAQRGDCSEQLNEKDCGLCWYWVGKGVMMASTVWLECRSLERCTIIMNALSLLEFSWSFFIIIFILYGSTVDSNFVLVSGIQQSDSVIHIHASILFQILFPFRLLQNIEQSSLCYTVGLCWLSIINIAVCTCQSQTPNLSLRPTIPPGNHKFFL